MNGKLNENQRNMVEEHLYVIEQVIWKCFKANCEINGLSYDDLYQTGAIALCKAAMNYDVKVKSKFSTYAFQAVKNEISGYIRRILKKHSESEQFLETAEYKTYYPLVDDFHREVENRDFLEFFSQTKERYSGVTRTGMDAIELRMQGFSCGDIARKHNVKASYITACISRAKKNLQKDTSFLEQLG